MNTQAEYESSCFAFWCNDLLGFVFSNTLFDFFQLAVAKNKTSASISARTTTRILPQVFLSVKVYLTFGNGFQIKDSLILPANASISCKDKFIAAICKNSKILQPQIRSAKTFKRIENNNIRFTVAVY